MTESMSPTESRTLVVTKKFLAGNVTLFDRDANFLLGPVGLSCIEVGESRRDCSLEDMDKALIQWALTILFVPLCPGTKSDLRDEEPNS